jgi:predicted GTPase
MVFLQNKNSYADYIGKSPKRQDFQMERAPIRMLFQEK